MPPAGRADPAARPSPSTPTAPAAPKRREYKELGEIAFLDRKREQFWKAVAADPLNFLDRVADRFLGHDGLVHAVRPDRTRPSRPWVFWIARVDAPAAVPRPACSWSARRCGGRCSLAQWTVIGVYLLYLLPYIAVSYYDRYGMPLVGVKVLLVIWGVDRLLRLVLRRSAQVSGLRRRPRACNPRPLFAHVAQLASGLNKKGLPCLYRMSPNTPPPGVHADRAARGHRHHRRL